MTHEIERISSDGKVKWRNARSKNHAVKDDGTNIKRLRPLSKTEIRVLEAIRSHEEPQQCNQAVCCDRGNATGGYKGGERDLARKDRAKNGGRENENNGDRVLGLAVRVDFPNPSRQWKYSISCNSKYKTRRSNYRYASVLDTDC